MNRLIGFLNKKDKKIATNSRKIKNLESQKILKELEEKCFYDKRFVAIICEELDDSILHDMTRFFDELKNDVKHVYLILHISAGGTARECTILNRLFLRFLKVNGHQITICVPEMAVSSGAQIAICGGTSLIMGRFAHLSPFDDQISGLGVKNIERISRKMKSKHMTLKDQEKIMRAEYLHKITIDELNTALTRRGIKDEVIKQVKKLFLNHRLYHSYPIDVEMIMMTGLQVEILDDKDVLTAFLLLYDLWLSEDE